MDGLKARLSFDAVAYDYDDEYLTIDTDTHTININNVYRLFGVQYDGNSKLIKFRIRNKLSDIQKMQDSIIYINWIDSRGVKGQSIAINKTISNDTCEFAWKVPFDALKNSGVLHFAMSAVVTKNSSSVIDQRWSTKIASVITPDGIYIKSYTPSSEEEDRIAQIYNELSNMINKQNDNLQSQVSSLKEDKVDKPTTPDDGKIPRAKGGDVEWVEVGQPTDEQTNSAVKKWLGEHPEATTTVQDYSLTINKMVIGALGYVTPEMFGAVGDGITDDTKAIQKAIDSVKNGYVLFQRLTYCVSKTLQITNKNIIFNNCILKRVSDCTVLNFDNSNNFKLSDVTITDNGSTYGNMIVGRRCENVKIKNVTVNSSSPHTDVSNGNWAMCLSGNAFHISGLRINNYESGLWADGLHFGYVTNSVIEDFVILSGDDSIAITQHEKAGTGFENKVSENIKFVNGVLKSAKASPFRLGFDNSGKRSVNEIDKCYHKNILFENIECEGGYFLRVEYISHDSDSLPISDENIKFTNISYKQDRIVTSYPPFYVSKEYSLINYFFDNCNIDCSFATDEMKQSFCYIASNTENEKSLLTFSDCLFNFGNIDGIVGYKINKVKFKNCNFLSNGKKIISIYGSCEFVESDIINYGEEANYFCKINASDNDKIYRLNGCFISNYKQFSNKNEDNHTFLFMDNCYFKTTINVLSWYGGNVNYNNIIKGDRKLNSSKDIFLYVPAGLAIKYDLSNYAYASLLVLSNEVETYEIIIRSSDGRIMLPSSKQQDAITMLNSAGVTISVVNRILTINNIEDVYKNVFIKCYAQTN